MKPTIQILAEKLIGLAGPKYWSAYRVLYHYIKKLEEAELIDEIGQISNPDIAPYLMAVGLSRGVQEALAEKMEELVG